MGTYLSPFQERARWTLRLLEIDRASILVQ
jgi:hypothetical protein